MPKEAKLVKYRRLQSIDIPSFCVDIATSCLNNTNELTERYIIILCSMLDGHAPLIERDAKRLRRRIENKWRDTKSNHVAYSNQCSVVTKELYNGKPDYNSNKIEETRGDNKALFRITIS